jgi:Bacterial archaeo-eukaryotic release factor family 3
MPSWPTAAERGPARSSTESAAVPRIGRSPYSSTSIVSTASCGTCSPASVCLLAAVRHRQALYRTANTYPGLLAEGIDGNPRDIPIDLLHRRAWEIAEPELRGAERAAASTYRALRGTGRTANRPEEMLIAAGHGRVDTLFISTDRTWGPAASEGTPLLRLGPSPSPGEQLDLAALATLHRGGAVFSVPPDRMPDVTPGAATFRY